MARKPHSESTKAKLREQKLGSKNPNYKNSSEYSAVHKWLVRNHGKASKCERKDCPRTSRKYEWALRKGCEHGQERERYIQLCVHCHKKYDAAPRSAEAKKNISNGKKIDWARRQKKILLPRGYLSWSQMSLWERNKAQYERIYFFGEEPPKSMYMTFGSEVADDAENGTSERDTVKALNALLPTYDKIEHKINGQIKTDAGLLVVHGRLDTYEDVPLRFRERKTGTVPWTQAKVNRHGQIDFYYMLIYLSTGKLPTEAHLDWAQTRVNDDEEVELTGHTQEFTAERSMTDVLRMISRCKSAALEIATAYEEKLGV